MHAKLLVNAAGMRLDGTAGNEEVLLHLLDGHLARHELKDLFLAVGKVVLARNVGHAHGKATGRKGIGPGGHDRRGFELHRDRCRIHPKGTDYKRNRSSLHGGLNRARKVLVQIDAPTGAKALLGQHDDEKRHEHRKRNHQVRNIAYFHRKRLGHQNVGHPAHALHDVARRTLDAVEPRSVDAKAIGNVAQNDHDEHGKHRVARIEEEGRGLGILGKKRRHEQRGGADERERHAVDGVEVEPTRGGKRS